jgi:hypothetical protein
MHIRNTLIRAILVILGSYFCAVSAWPQEPAFRIDSYIPQYFTDFQWRMEGYFSAEGYRKKGQVYIEGEEARYTNVSSLDKQTFRASSNMDYQYETIPRYFNINVQGSYFIDNVNPDGRAGYRHDSEPGIFPAIDAGYYLHSDLLVFLSGSAGWIYAHNLHDVNPDSRRIEYTVDAATGLGWGRIYDGRFAATAMYILDELKGKGVLSRPPTFAEMDSLTEIVYSRRLESYDDSRLHQIASLLSIMEFLESRGIINYAGPYDYLLIQDVWNYFPNESRRFGWMIKAGVGLDYHKRLVQTTDEHESDFGIFFHTYLHEEEVEQQPFFFFQADYYKPWGLRWQLNAFFEYKYFFESYNLNKRDEYRYQPSQFTSHREFRTNYSAPYRISAEASIDYIFDSRTSAGATIGYVRSHFNSDYEHHGVETGILSSQATIDYRIAVPTTLRVAIEYRREDETETWGYAERISVGVIDDYEYFTSVRLIHYLF